MHYSWQFDILRTWEEVDDPAFLERWQRAYDTAPSRHVFSSPLLVKTWTDCYRKFQEIEPVYFIARSGGTEIYLPLVIWRRNWKNMFLRILVPAGYSDFDYHDPVVSCPVTNSLMTSFWTLVQQQVIEAIAYDKIDLNGMRFPGAQGFWEKEEACPFIDMSRYEDFEDYFDRLGKSLRKDIRRKKRILDDCGSVEFHVYSRQDIEGAMQSFPLFLDAHTRRWPNAFKAPGLHEALLRNGLPDRLVHFSEIRIDGSPVSWEIGFRDHDRAYSYMPAYQEAYADRSPGKVHLAFLIKECFQRGIRVFDFMRGAEEYKGSWADSIMYVHRSHQYADRLYSRMKIYTDQTFKNIKKLLYVSPLCLFSVDLIKKLDVLLRTQFILNAESCEIFMEFAGCANLG
jgi:CelD/BcsL family acetyltransferase involved in cellulose biosynthesis